MKIPADFPPLILTFLTAKLVPFSLLLIKNNFQILFIFYTLTQTAVLAGVDPLEVENATSQ